MIRVKESKAKARLLQDTKQIRETIEGMASGSLDAYVGFRKLYAIYCRRSGVHQELEAFFRIPGIEPDGRIQVDDAFRSTVRALAVEYLSKHAN
jgi:hypothetical protein